MRTSLALALCLVPGINAFFGPGPIQRNGLVSREQNVLTMAKKGAPSRTDAVPAQTSISSGSGLQRVRKAGSLAAADAKSLVAPALKPVSTISAWVELLRLHNGVPSVLLVAAGAYVSTHHFASLLGSKVLLTELSAVLVACGSCVLNDYQDLAIDAINKPDRPLVTGTSFLIASQTTNLLI
jgi:UbiA prenyltransferase family